eukprot:9805764-Alexandrium_andersonii.AAC.1
MTEGSSDSRAALPPTVASMLATSHASNWLSVNENQDLIAYDQGSIPGDPWVDLSFGFLHAKIARD